MSTAAPEVPPAEDADLDGHTYPISFMVSVCDNWGHRYRAYFSTEEQAVDFVERKKSTCAIHTLPDHPIDERFERLWEALDPTCPHGLSMSNCYDDLFHYAPDHVVESWRV